MKIKKSIIISLLILNILLFSACSPETGDKGPRGAQGDKGPTGDAGDVGDKGATGISGDKGIDGIDGRNIEFSFNQDGLCYRYYTEDDSSEWTLGISFEDIFKEMNLVELKQPLTDIELLTIILKIKNNSGYNPSDCYVLQNLLKKYELIYIYCEERLYFSSFIGVVREQYIDEAINILNKTVLTPFKKMEISIEKKKEMIYDLYNSFSFQFRDKNQNLVFTIGIIDDNLCLYYEDEFYLSKTSFYDSMYIVMKEYCGYTRKK